MARQPIVYVLDDPLAAGESVATIAAAQGLPIESIASAEQALRSLVDDPPGCLVVDLGAQGMTGIELHRRLKEQGSQLPVIVVAAHADVPMAVAALKQGVFMLLQKPCTAEALGNSIAEALDFDTEQRARRAQEQLILARYAKLSDKERQVLKLIVEGRSNKAIASHLNIALRTVELRRAAVLRKLKADSVAELVRMTIGLPES